MKHDETPNMFKINIIIHNLQLKHIGDNQTWALSYQRTIWRCSGNDWASLVQSTRSSWWPALKLKTCVSPAVERLGEVSGWTEAQMVPTWAQLFELHLSSEALQNTKPSNTNIRSMEKIWKNTVNLDVVHLVRHNLSNWIGWTGHPHKRLLSD